MGARRCSFCGSSASPATRVVSGPDDVAICHDCAALAVEVLGSDQGLPEPDIVLAGIGSLVTLDPRRGGMLGIVERATVAIRRGRVVYVGPDGELPEPYRGLPVVDCEGRAVIPGLVDASCSVLGPPPDARPEPVELADAGAGALRRMLRRGVTCVDLAVGGGPDPTWDTLTMAVARSVGERLGARVSVTWRCSPQLETTVVREVMAPTASRLASFALVECHGDGADLASRLSACRPLRHRLVCHEPEPSACLGFLQASVSVEGIPPHLLAGDAPTPVVPWWKPGVALSHWAAGVAPALATFSDPSTRLVAGMGLVLMAAVDLAGLGFEQALWSVTKGAARAIGDTDRGWIHLGGPADLVVIEGSSPEDLLVQPDGDPVWRVVVGGVEQAT
jgi:imidazolonepropionase